MAEPVKETALVIRSIRHGETSRIVTMFGMTVGKFAVIAKGARKGKGGGALGTIDPPSYIEGMVYFKPTRSVQILGQVNLLDSFRNLKNDLTLTAFSSVVLEYINRFYTDGEPDQELFQVALHTLKTLNTEEELKFDTNTNRSLTATLSLPYIILWLFQLDLIRLTGFELNPYACPICGKAMAELSRSNFLLVEHGAFCCHTCRPDSNNTITLSGESVGLLRRLLQRDRGNIQKVKASPLAQRETTRALDRFLSYHNPQTGKSSALNMLETLTRPSNADE